MGVKPLIGITMNQMLDEEKYVAALVHGYVIERAGGIPIYLPYIKNEQMIYKLVQQLNGLYVTGGDDIDPTFFGEEPIEGLRRIVAERDVFEQSIIQKILRKNKPVLAVCRGAQILNIAFGGDMYQDVKGQINHALLQHEQKAKPTHTSHFVTLKEDSKLYEIMRKKEMKVNSFHHQAIRRVKEPFYITAKASDGIVEAIESKAHHFAIGVQWHPKYLAAKQAQASLALYQTFIKKCIERKRKGAHY